MTTSDEHILLLGKIDGKLDSLIERADSLTSKLDKHEHRITKLENWKHYLLGAVAVIGLVITEAWKWVTHKL